MLPGEQGLFQNSFLTFIPIGEIAVRLGLALLLGGVIGIEREARNRAAGLRTHMLVALASAAFTVVTIELAIASVRLEKEISADPIRLIEAVVAGVAFLGAGTIIQSRGSVRGITTGAGMWVAGSVGVACGAGYYVVAGIVAFFALVVLSVLGYLERRVKDEVRPTADDRAD